MCKTKMTEPELIVQLRLFLIGIMMLFHLTLHWHGLVMLFTGKTKLVIILDKYNISPPKYNSASSAEVWAETFYFVKCEDLCRHKLEEK